MVGIDNISLGLLNKNILESSRMISKIKTAELSNGFSISIIFIDEYIDIDYDKVITETKELLDDLVESDMRMEMVVDDVNKIINIKMERE